MRKDAGVDGDAQRISQLGWMLFLKIFDEMEEEWETIKDNYKSPIRKDLRWREWAADEEGMTGDCRSLRDRLLSNENEPVVFVILPGPHFSPGLPATTRDRNRCDVDQKNEERKHGTGAGLSTFWR